VGTAFARTAWSPAATYVAMVSRPLGGKKWAGLCKTFKLGGTGHNHPAQNHFVLFGRGEVLAGDPGYTYTKKTRNHNTVLVDGKGQLGDGEMWPKPTAGTSRLTGFEAEGDLAIIAGDAASAYPAALKVTAFERVIVLAGQDLVVVHDSLAAGKAATFSWLLHHWGKLATAGAAHTITRNKARLTVAPLLPAGLKVHTETYRPNYIHPTRDLTPPEPDVNLLELRSPPTKATTFFVALQVGAAGTTPPAIKDVSSKAGGYRALRVGDILVLFNPTGKQISVTLPWGVAVKTVARALVARKQGPGKGQLVTLPKGAVLPPPPPADQAALDLPVAGPDGAPAAADGPPTADMPSPTRDVAQGAADGAVPDEAASRGCSCAMEGGAGRSGAWPLIGVLVLLILGGIREKNGQGTARR
jgi:MYXO-CTERM domain-containing protein